MEKITAEIIKNGMIGETSGHMAMIPNNPVVFSMFQIYHRECDGDLNVAFIKMLKDMAEALESKK